MEKSQEATQEALEEKATPQIAQDPKNASRSSWRLAFGVLLVVTGGYIYLVVTGLGDPLYILYRVTRDGIPIALASIGALLISRELSKRKFLNESRFVDVDARSRASQLPFSSEDAISRLSELLASVAKTKMDLSTSASSPSANIGRRELPLSTGADFSSYFESIRRLLEEKAAVADEKASILLDKGTTYSRFGIVFFIFCIVCWQAIARLDGFHIQHVYGIVSTSLLFVFIEFLSAWFLKQYRQFIDTSTYLIKVKSIFDRYMLVYLASKEAIANGNDAKKSNRLLLDLLSEEISWPDSYLTRSPDISFAREALEAVTLLAKSIQREQHDTNSRKTKKARSTSST